MGITSETPSAKTNKPFGHSWHAVSGSLAYCWNILNVAITPVAAGSKAAPSQALYPFFASMPRACGSSCVTQIYAFWQIIQIFCCAGFWALAFYASESSNRRLK